MAKKIKIYGSLITATEALKRNKVEHISIDYGNDVFVVVQNKDFESTKQTLKSAQVVFKSKTTRHYERLALRYKYYQPVFTCKCRQCGKSFEHTVKEACWCSKECRKVFKDSKRQAKETA